MVHLAEVDGALSLGLGTSKTHGLNKPPFLCKVHSLRYFVALAEREIRQPLGEGFSEYSGRGRISLQSLFQTQGYDTELLIRCVDLSLGNVPVVLLKPGPL